jgi:hypothetical protein
MNGEAGELRPQLYPGSAESSGQVRYVLDAKLEAQPIG